VSRVPPRLAPLPVAEWPAEARDLLRGRLPRADRHLPGPGEHHGNGAAAGESVPAILGLFARHAPVTAPWFGFAGALLTEGALAPRDRELLVLRVAARTGCSYLRSEHSGAARDAGLSVAQVAAGPGDPEVTLWSERDRDLIRAADQLVASQVVDDETWQRLARAFDDRGLLELLLVVGGYTCLAMVLNSTGLDASP
jgi:4-carboxymuconolactone decarboxylase